MGNGFVFAHQIGVRKKGFFKVRRGLKNTSTTLLMMNCFGNMADIADIRKISN